jgi:hypothetical protein
VFVSHDSDFRAAYPGNHFIGGQFPGGLSSGGELLQLKRGATVVDRSTTRPGVGNWPGPGSRRNGGPSLELKNPAFDKRHPRTAGLFSSNGGTPNAQNTAFGGGGGGGGGGGTGCSAANPSLDFGDTWCYMATGGDLGTAWRGRGLRRLDLAVGSRHPRLQEHPARNDDHPDQRPDDLLRPGRRSTWPRRSQRPRSTPILDDGAVVYVNGTEAARTNLAGGTVSFTQKALVGRDGCGGDHPLALTLPAGLFHPAPTRSRSRCTTRPTRPATSAGTPS